MQTGARDERLDVCFDLGRARAGFGHPRALGHQQGHAGAYHARVHQRDRRVAAHEFHRCFGTGIGAAQIARDVNRDHLTALEALVDLLKVAHRGLRRFGEVRISL